MMGNYFGGIGFGFGWIFMVLFWGLVIWAIVALVRGTGVGAGHSCCGGHNHGGHGRGGDALDILKERYAKGEISEEEFQRMKKELE
jgi:putative membrane protein